MIQQATQKLPHGDIIENQAARYQAARAVIETEGVRIKHYRMAVLTEVGPVGLHNGGITVAFRQLRTDSFVEIATSLCSRHDLYNRKVGTALAVEQFMNMHRIRVPVFGATAEQAVDALFQGYTLLVDVEA